MKFKRIVLVLPMLVASYLFAQSTPLALTAFSEALGNGTSGTVMGTIFQIAPEDRERAGKRVRVVTTLRRGEEIVDRQSAVVAVEKDGTAMLYREWDPGTYMLEISLVSIDGTTSGVWIGEIEVPEAIEPFEAPEGAPVEALALELSAPREGGVKFLPPPNLGGLGAVQIEVEAPENTASVEFIHDGTTLGRRNRPPWTVSIPLGHIIRRTEVRAVAFDAHGRLLWVRAIAPAVINVHQFQNMLVSRDGELYFTFLISAPIDLDPGPDEFILEPVPNDNPQYTPTGIVLCKWNNDGDFLWGKQLDGTGSALTVDVQIDALDNVYLLGYFFGPIDFDPGPDTYEVTSTLGPDVFLCK